MLRFTSVEAKCGCPGIDNLIGYDVLHVFMVSELRRCDVLTTMLEVFIFTFVCGKVGVRGVKLLPTVLFAPSVRSCYEDGGWGRKGRVEI